MKVPTKIFQESGLIYVSRKIIFCEGWGAHVLCELELQFYHFFSEVKSTVISPEL